MNKLLGKGIKYTTLTLVIGFAIYYLYNNKEYFEQLFKIKAQFIAPLLLTGLIVFIFLALEFKYVIKLFDVTLRFKEWFGLSAINSMYNYFVPARGGLVARAYYLKKNYNFEYSKYASLLGGSLLLGFLVASFSAMLYLVIGYYLFEEFYHKLFYLSLGLFLATAFISLIIVCFPNLRIITGWKYLDNLLLQIVLGFSYFKKNNRLLVLIILSQFGLIFFMGLRLYLSFLALNIEVNLINLLIVQSIVVFSMVISITPGNLGIKEGIIGFLASTIGVPLNDALLAATIDRAINMLIIFLLGGVFHFILIRKELK